MMTNLLDNTIKLLFDRNYDDDLSEAEEDRLDNIADTLVQNEGWSAVFDAAVKFLHDNCLTPESVINFANLYWCYGWYDKPIPDPHKFLAYFYYRINFETAKYDDMDILDSLAITILPRAGFREADLLLNTQYMPENDPKIIAEVEIYRKQKE